MSRMITDEEMKDLPEDPDEAFVFIASSARQHLDEALEGRAEDNSSMSFYRDYMTTVLAAAKVYEVSPIDQCSTPRVGDEHWNFYEQFMADVNLCVTELRLLNAKRNKKYSVRLDAPTKSKLHHLLAQMRETIVRLEISAVKKERLYAKIEALALEIDRDRTVCQALGALLIEAAGDVGEAAKQLEPVVRLIERILRGRIVRHQSPDSCSAGAQTSRTAD
jgi:hypothetical protein